MNIKQLKEEVKKIALESGAKLVGVGSRERLEDAPTSGQMDYCLPGAQSCIIYAYPNTIEALENFFSKKERWSMRILQDLGYVSNWKTTEKIAQFIEENTDYKAHPVIPNGAYRNGLKNIITEGEGFPPFSLRYGAVAAGLGHIGWSGNLVTEEYGGSVYLGGVLTTAPLEPEPMAEKNHCNKCKICQKACSTGYVSLNEVEERDPPFIGGVKQVYGKRGLYMKCGVGCAGYTGLSEDGKWSIWSPNHICLKNIPDEELTIKYFEQLMARLIKSRDTPRNIRKFNQKIVAQFGMKFQRGNVGLSPIEEANPRCGNCIFICVADPKKRIELYKMLINSGKVFIDDKGREFVKRIDENDEEITYYPPTWEDYKKEKGIQ